MKTKLLLLTVATVVATYKLRGPISFLIMNKTKIRYTEDIRISMSETDFEEEQHKLDLRYSMPGSIEVWNCTECETDFLISWNEIIEKFAITTKEVKTNIHRIGGIVFIFPDINQKKIIEPESFQLGKLLGNEFGKYI